MRSGCWGSCAAWTTAWGSRVFGSDERLGVLPLESSVAAVRCLGFSGWLGGRACSAGATGPASSPSHSGASGSDALIERIVVISSLSPAVAAAERPSGVRAGTASSVTVVWPAAGERGAALGGPSGARAWGGARPYGNIVVAAPSARAIAPRHTRQCPRTRFDRRSIWEALARRLGGRPVGPQPARSDSPGRSTSPRRGHVRVPARPRKRRRSPATMPGFHAGVRRATRD